MDNLFPNGRKSVQDDSRSMQPSTLGNVEMVNNVKDGIQKDRGLTIREIAGDLDISFHVKRY